jgi:CheY-like chemotaxis protein
MVAIGGEPGAFLIVGVILLCGLGLLAFARRRGRQEGAAHWLGVNGKRAIWVGVLVLALGDIAISTVKLLYPTAEMTLEMSSVVELVKAALWPIAFLVFISYFAGPISRFLESLTSADLDIAGNKIKLQRKVAEVTAALSVAEAKSTGTADAGATSPEKIESLARNAVSNMGLVGGSHPPRLLWVDDMPQNNISLVHSFEAVGMSIDKALDTEEGLAMLQHRPYDLIIEDMGRPSGKDAGYEFLAALKEQNISIPVIIFAARMGNVELRNDAISRGAIAATNRPSEVFRLVTALAPRLAATRE